MTALYILIGLLALVGLYVIVTYNALVSLRLEQRLSLGVAALLTVNHSQTIQALG